MSACGSKATEITRSLRIAKQLDYSATHIFIVPHPDDWQLFMGEYAVDLMRSKDTPVVIVMTDAGDYGRGDSYWPSRENAALASVRSVLNYDLVNGDASENTNDVTIGDRTLAHHQLRNVSVYFLRLPDGDIDGQGYASNGLATLLKLYRTEIDSIRTVDSKNVYTYDDIRSVLQNIIAKELAGTSKPAYFYIQDPGSETNFSNSDHLVTQYLARDAISNQKPRECKVRAFVDYRIKAKTRNLNESEMAKKAQLFSAYDVVMIMQQNQCGLCAQSHYDWLSRSYMREFDC